MGGAYIQTVRDRPRRITGTAVRWGVLYVSASLALLQTLDVFSERLGLSDGAFLYVTVALVLLLPGVLGAAALRAVAREERAPAGPRPAGRPSRRGGVRQATDAVEVRRGWEPAGRARRAERPREPGSAVPTHRELAELHYRLGRFHEQVGETSRAAYHYARFLEASGAAKEAGPAGPPGTEPAGGARGGESPGAGPGPAPGPQGS